MRRYLTTAVFVGILGTAGSTFADPLLVTSGSHFQTWDRGWPWRLTGDGFDLSGSGVSTHSPIFDCPSSCDPGTIISLDTVMLTDDFGRAGFGNAAEIGGTRYSGFHWAGRLEFESGTVTALPGIYDLPFTFTGALTAYSNAERTGPPLFSTPTLVGAGTVRIRIIDPPAPNTVEINDVTYTFAEPVPEPATMMLLGTGLAGVFAARRRRG